MLFRMIREIKVSSDWFGCVHVISFHVAREKRVFQRKITYECKIYLKKDC